MDSDNEQFVVTLFNLTVYPGILFQRKPFVFFILWSLIVVSIEFWCYSLLYHVLDLYHQEPIKLISFYFVH